MPIIVIYFYNEDPFSSPQYKNKEALSHFYGGQQFTVRLQNSQG